MNRSWRVAFFCCVVAGVGVWASGTGAAPYDDPNGYTHVVCTNNPAQSYELYIPPTAPATNSPILYAFAPDANGKWTLQQLAEVARTNGWILAASNNSQNGPWSVIFTAQDALITDTEARLSLHPTRRFAAGFSGGARASLALAFRYPSKICGTLCMGAGWPINTELEASNTGLVVKILIGTQDSNYTYDIPHTQGQLWEASVRCDVSTYNDAHVWPPAGLVLSGAQWLNQNAQTDPNAGVVPQTGSAQSMFRQSPPLPTGAWTFYASDNRYGYTAFEDFQGVQNPITRVQWCGMSTAYNSSSGYFVPTNPESNTFVVSLHPDVAGRPGAAVYQETVTADRVDGPGLYSNNFLLRHYTAHLSSPVTLQSGWVGIRHVAGANSVSTWLASTNGNGHALQRTDSSGAYSVVANDLTLALSQDELACTFTTSSSLGKPPYEVQFHGTVDGSMGEAVTWLWNFGDGTTATGTANPTHVYTTDGHFVVSVTVSTSTRTTTTYADSSIVVSQALPAMSPGFACALLIALSWFGAVAVVGMRNRRRKP